MTYKQSYPSNAACLPRRSRTKAGVVECASPLALSVCYLLCTHAVSAIFHFAATRGFSIFNSFVPRLMKPIESYSSLLKPFFKNPFYFRFRILDTGLFSFRSVTYGHLRKPLHPSSCNTNLYKPMSSYVKPCQPPPGGRVGKLPRPRAHLQLNLFFVVKD